MNDTLESTQPLELLAYTPHSYCDRSTGAWYQVCIIRTPAGDVCEAGVLFTVLDAL